MQITYNGISSNQSFVSVSATSVGFYSTPVGWSRYHWGNTYWTGSSTENHGSISVYVDWVAKINNLQVDSGRFIYTFSSSDSQFTGGKCVNSN